MGSAHPWGQHIIWVVAAERGCHELTATARTDLGADEWVGHVVVVDPDVTSNATCLGIICIHR